MIINDYYSNARKIIFEKIRENPVDLENFRVHKNVSLWPELFYENEMRFIGNKKFSITENLSLIVPGIENYFGKDKSSLEEINEIKGRKIGIGDSPRIWIDYRFLE